MGEGATSKQADSTTEKLSKTMASMQKVLGVTDLLEQILLNLACTDILNAQFVCRAWRDSINGSTLLRHGCFLKPSIGPLDLTSLFINTSFNKTARANDIGQMFRQQRQQASVPVILEGSVQVITPAMVLQHFSRMNTHVLNPLVRLVTRLQENRNNYRKVYRTIAKAKGAPPPNSKWLDMYLSQPPMTKQQTTQFPDAPWINRVELWGLSKRWLISNPSGLTIRDLITFMQNDTLRMEGPRLMWWYPVYAGALETGSNDEDDSKIYLTIN